MVRKGGGPLLTAKQEKFVQGLVSGLTQRKAYYEAFPNSKKWKPETVDNKASKLFKENEILARYNALMDEHKEKALWTREEAVNTLKWLIDRAMRSIDEMDEGYVRQGSSTALINAIKELNNLEDIYPEKAQNINVSGKLDNPYGGLTTEQLEKLADGYE